jgi:exodeoxyribonuclease V alpha subunit
MIDPASEFMPLARLTLGDGYDGTAREPWVRPLAQLFEAASRGKGQLPLSQCPVAPGVPPGFFAFDGDMVLLPRYAALWREVRERVEALFARPIDRLPDAAVRDALAAILPPKQEKGDKGQVVFDNQQQRLAAAAFVDAPIGVLTGGPGTGKTTSAAALLAVRKRLDPALLAEDVLLCAPTGKAACRLAESVRDAAVRLNVASAESDFLCALVPKTLHKALEWGPKPPEQGGPFGRRAGRPLTQRLIVVDEASMVDLDLMAHLLRALGPGASLLLLGDADQLESVETGGVLAEVVARGDAQTPPAPVVARWSARLGADCKRSLRKKEHAAAGNKPLPGLVVRLQQSYRAKGSPWILDLSAIARPNASGTVADFLACCRKWAPNIRRYDRRGEFYEICRDRWREAAKVTAGWTFDRPPHDDVMTRYLKRFQLLCGDNAQVDRANRMGTVALLRDGEPDRGGLGMPHGCPVLITQNRPALGLSNGDIGVALGAEAGSGALVVAFPGIALPIPIAQLPGHQAAFALTIHKSQGSEWHEVAIDLPNESELLDRNLLYTAITRSSGALHVFAAGEKALTAILMGGSAEES